MEQMFKVKFNQDMAMLFRLNGPTFLSLLVKVKFYFLTKQVVEKIYLTNF